MAFTTIIVIGIVIILVILILIVIIIIIRMGLGISPPAFRSLSANDSIQSSLISSGFILHYTTFTTLKKTFRILHPLEAMRIFLRRGL